MKIAYILSSFIAKAGTERILSDKMNYLVKRYGYDITFITYEQGNHPMAFSLDKRIRVIDLNTRFFPLYKLNPVRRVIAKSFQKRKLKSKLHDVLSVVNPDFVVLTTYDFDKFGSILTLPYRFVIESHICISDVRQEFRQHNVILKLFGKYLDSIHFKIMNKADALVSLTSADKTNWEKHVNIPIFVIPNLVTVYPNDISCYSERSNRIICVGRLTRQKGFDYLIKAWALIANKYPGWKIDIFGSGDLEDFLIQMIENYNLKESITINKPTSNIFEEYDRSSIYVLSSRYEGFCLVLLEAMSFGIPCISFNCPHGPSDMITNGEEGILVPVGDINKLADSIEWMITHKEERERMSQNSREKVKYYLAENIMPQWVELFNKIK